MYTLSINNRSLGPYNAIWHPDGKKEGDIRPILYDIAQVELSDSTTSYALCYKESSSLLGKAVKYADVIDTKTGELFSLQVSNIFFFTVVNGDPKVVIRIGDKLKLYEEFGKKERDLEPDGDKGDPTPLGYYDTFVAYDDDFYYPVILDAEKQKLAKLHRFIDYYGFRSYVSGDGKEHFILFIEDETSTEEVPNWYFVDNFVRVSERIDLPDYVEAWSIDEEGVIYFEATSKKKYYIDPTTNKMIQGTREVSTSESFVFERVYEDTDSQFIVAKNDSGYFVIDGTASKIGKTDQQKIRYFKEFIWCLNPAEASDEIPFFLMQKEDDQIILIDAYALVRAGTDLLITDAIASANIQGGILQVQLKNGETRSYFLEET